MKIWTNTKTLDGFINEFEITENKAEADVALIGSKPIFLEEFPKLKGIFRAGIGRDNVPIEEAAAKGVKVKFPAQKTIAKIYEETANFTCHLILRMMYADVGTLDPWIKYNRTILNDRTLLIIGTGNIGNRVLNKMKTLMTVKTFDILSNSEDELKDFTARADCITIHIPKHSKNINFIDAEKLSWMKDGAVIVNTS
ncbi:hydroxyacid dehydrogenase, partial [candidate division KSB1 bacterium]|nr:hydroxyacid dehydrogenase [candidate division KSB1 bacterium]